MIHYYGNIQPVFQLEDAATVALDAAVANFFHLDSSSSRTIGVPSNPSDGQIIIVRFTNESGSNQTLAVSTATGGFKFTDTVTALTATPAGKTDRFIAEYVLSENRWHITGYSKGT